MRDPRRRESTFGYRGPSGGQERWRLASRTDRAGKVTSYSYNSAARTTTVTAPPDRIWKYAFDANRQVTKITNPLNEDTLVAWTPDRHVRSVTTPTVSGTVAQSFDYNQNGQLTAVTNEENEQTRFAYTDLAADAADVAGKWKAGRTIGHLSRLRSKTAPKGVATTSVPDDFQWTFDYDSATSLGNLIRVTDPERKATSRLGYMTPW